MKCNLDMSKKYEIGYILGALKGDGFIGKHTKKQKMIMLSVSNKPFSERFRDCLFNVCGRKYKIGKVKNYRYSQGYCWVVRCTIKDIVNFFEHYDINSLLSDENDIKAGFLKGFFDAEGCSFCKYYPDRQSYARVVVASNFDRNLLEFCQKLLNSFKLKTRKIPNQVSGRNAYTLNLIISKENLTMFKEKIGFSIPYKTLNLEKCLETYGE